MSARADGGAGTVILEHAKGRGLTLRLAVREYRGHRFLDVREWVDRHDGPRATGRGCTVPLEALSALYGALGTYLAANDTGGLSSAS